MKIIYRGKPANIMKFARAQTIDLAKKVYDELGLTDEDNAMLGYYKTQIKLEEDKELKELGGKDVSGEDKN